MTQRKSRILLAVQGEGRGHMTQAIALKERLTEAGYEICGILMGTSSRRDIPQFFLDRMKGIPLLRFQSPNFVTDEKQKRIRILPSILQGLARMGKYRREMGRIKAEIKRLQPDLLINFYEPLIGLFYLLQAPKLPMVCIAHQYVYNHPKFNFPKVSRTERLALRVLTNLSAARAKARLALSIYPMPDYPSRNIQVVPPLLRTELFRQQPDPGDYILVYLLNSGYTEEIMEWHRKNPDVMLHCFTDKKDIARDTWEVSPTLHFHRLNDKLFLEMMAGCKAFATTAGFESVCEAMYLGKPVFMVPVAGHFEQWCNARDAAGQGAGIYDDSFRIDALLDYLPSHNTDYSHYQTWVNSAAGMFEEKIRSVIQGS